MKRGKEKVKKIKIVNEKLITGLGDKTETGDKEPDWLNNVASPSRW